MTAEISENEEIKKRIQQIKDNCIFCKIVKGEMSSYKIFEDDICIAILDINPASKGHILLMPKEHYMILPMVPDEVFGHLGIISKLLQNLLKESLNPESVKVFVANGAAAGQQSQHFMIHIIPEYSDNKPIKIENLEDSEESLSKEEIKDLADKLKANLSKMH